jgi:hypothetical protein
MIKETNKCDAGGTHKVNAERWTASLHRPLYLLLPIHFCQNLRVCYEPHEIRTRVR